MNDRDKEGIGNRKGKYKLFEILGASKNGNNAIGGFILGFNHYALLKALITALLICLYSPPPATRNAF